MSHHVCFDDVPVIRTTSGLLKGYFYDGEYLFKGVPYAEADRFQMPRPSHWDGVLDATSYGFVCPLLHTDTPSAELMVPHRYWPQDEHCQNLNIWTSSLSDGEKRPVIVWLHGGGYEAGSSIEQVAYDGFNMCRDGGVVVVSVNHRLNILGYLDLSPFGEKYRNSGNAGNADIVAALSWVHDNIAAFGGDPGNVTIFGQSGGGMKVTDMMQTPAADGLFQRAFVMSGVGSKALMPTCTGDGRMVVTAMLKELGLSEAEVEKLETVPYFDLARAYLKVRPALQARGVYTGNSPLKNEEYFGNPLEYGFRKEALSIPLLVGSVFGEFSFRPESFDKYELTREQALERIAKVYHEHAPEMSESFREAFPDKALTDLLNLDRAFRGPSKDLARLHSEGGAGSYLYEFTLEFPIHHRKIAWHCSDIPFFFDNIDKVEVCQIPGVAEKLQQQMFSAFMNFARTGNPATSLLPCWDSVTPQRTTTMIFDKRCEARVNFDDRLYQQMEDYLGPFSFASMMNQDIQH